MYPLLTAPNSRYVNTTFFSGCIQSSWEGTGVRGSRKKLSADSQPELVLVLSNRARQSQSPSSTCFLCKVHFRGRKVEGVLWKGNTRSQKELEQSEHFWPTVGVFASAQLLSLTLHPNLDKMLTVLKWKYTPLSPPSFPRMAQEPIKLLVWWSRQGTCLLLHLTKRPVFSLLDNIKV